MKRCVLCEGAAMLYCESDRASLCWDCDAKVHGANFLVARHSRSLLCRRCQSPTPWRAEGARLGSTASVCERCCLERSQENGHGDGGRIGTGGEVETGQRRRGEDDDEEDDDDGAYEEEDEADDDEDEDEDEGENQVVPWALTPPPPESSSSSEAEESTSADAAGSSGGFLKRMRESADLSCSHQDDPTNSSQRSRLSPVYGSTSLFAHGESPPSADCRNEPMLFRSAVPSRPAAPLDVRVHGNRGVVGVVSDGHCSPPI